MLEKQQLITLYTNLVRVRKLDEAMVKAFTAGKFAFFFHSQQGQEAVGVGACSFLNKDDYLLYSHRGNGIGKTVPKGVLPRRIIAEHYMKATGTCGGISGFHTADMDLGIPGISGTLGGSFGLAPGMGIAAKMRGKKQIVMCIEGDGTYGRGTFHEGMIMAANWKLPVVFIIENNEYMAFSHICEYHPVENMADLGTGYGIQGVVVDGQDVVAVCEAVQTAIEQARGGGGPSLIECKTYRIRPHAEGLPDIKCASLRPREEIEAWKKRDPIKLFKKRLLNEEIMTEAEMDRIDREAEEEIAASEKSAIEDPPADYQSHIRTALYSD